MKKILASTLILCSSSALSADFVKSAAPDSGNKVGVGVSYIGSTGVSVYADTNRDNFLQAAVSFAPDSSYNGTLDYAYGYRNAFTSVPSLTPFWGIGAVVLYDRNDYWARYTGEEKDSTTYAGARLPLGLNYVIPKTPVQIAAELAPSLLLTPKTYSYVQGGVSARVLF